MLPGTPPPLLPEGAELCTLLCKPCGTQAYHPYARELQPRGFWAAVGRTGTVPPPLKSFAALEWMECMHAHTTQPAWNADKEQEHFQQLPLPPAQPGLQNTWNADKEQERFQQLPLPPAQPGLRPGMS